MARITTLHRREAWRVPRPGARDRTAPGNAEAEVRVVVVRAATLAPERWRERAIVAALSRLVSRLKGELGAAHVTPVLWNPLHGWLVIAELPGSHWTGVPTQRVYMAPELAELKELAATECTVMIPLSVAAVLADGADAPMPDDTFWFPH